LTRQINAGTSAVPVRFGSCGALAHLRSGWQTHTHTFTAVAFPVSAFVLFKAVAQRERFFKSHDFHAS
jgi:hypothetical protein